MTKSDLKTGMRLTVRSGKIAIVLLNTNEGDIATCLASDGDSGCYFNLSELDDNLLSKHEEADVVKIESPKTTMSQLQLHKLVWEREDSIIEMTLEDIKQKLGLVNLRIIDKS